MMTMRIFTKFMVTVASLSVHHALLNFIFLLSYDANIIWSFRLSLQELEFFTETNDENIENNNN